MSEAVQSHREGIRPADMGQDVPMLLYSYQPSQEEQRGCDKLSHVRKLCQKNVSHRWREQTFARDMRKNNLPGALTEGAICVLIRKAKEVDLEYDTGPIAAARCRDRTPDTSRIFIQQVRLICRTERIVRGNCSRCYLRSTEGDIQRCKRKVFGGMHVMDVKGLGNIVSSIFCWI